METRYSLLPRIPVTLLCDQVIGEFEGWRHTIGHGGVNKYPLPPRVSKGLAGLKPRLVRTFIQEYFNIYPEHGKFDFSALDPYMESLAASGGKVAACICIKPKPLYPVIDQTVIMPNDVAEWQNVVETLVKRYSVEKEIVTYWEIANESDIGEWGGCPYLTHTPADYNAYYKITQEAVLRAFPAAMVGGLALANAGSELLEGLLAYCHTEGLRLDFVSWHLYSDVPAEHAGNVTRIREMMKKYFPDKLPEMLITEMSNSFPRASVEDGAFDSLRPAAMAASVFAMMDARLDWSFYYHIWDQVNVASQFAPFYADPDIMLVHWNMIPHRFGLFGVCGEVRPSYFFYQMLTMMGESELATEGGAGDLRVKAAVDERGALTAMLVNYDVNKSRELVAEIDYAGVTDGLKLLTVYRVDNDRRWDAETLEMKPVERRYVDVSARHSPRTFYNHVYCPANSVTLVSLEPVTEEQMLAEYHY